MAIPKIDIALNKAVISSGTLEKEVKVKGTSEQVDDKKIVKADNKNAAVLKYVEDNNKQDTSLLKNLLRDAGENIKNLLSPATKDIANQQRVNPGEKEHIKRQISNNSMSGGDNSVSTAGVKSLVQEDQKHGDKSNPNYNPMLANSLRKFEPGVSLVNAKRKKGQDEDDEDTNRKRKRKKANLPNRKNIIVPEMLKGAIVSESGTQDMFISSSKTQQKVSAIQKKTPLEEVTSYEMSKFAWDIFDTISNHINPKSPNGLNESVQKDYFITLIAGIENISDINSNSYRNYIRDVIMGTMKASLEHTLDAKDCTKMIFSSLMNISPHDDNPDFMSKTLNIIVSEMMYSRLRTGYTLKDISYNIGASLFTLFTYYRNYQNIIVFDKELEHKFNRAIGEALWQASTQMSKTPQLAAKTNVDAFIQGRNDEETSYTKNLYKEIATNSIKKVFKK